MPSKPTDVAEIKITVDEQGTATLSGLNYQDLQHILTIASLYAYGKEPSVKPISAEIEKMLPGVQHANNRENLAHYMWERGILQILKGHMNEAIRPGYHDGLPAAREAHADYLRRMERLENETCRLESEAAKTAAEKVAEAESAKGKAMADLSEMMREMSRKLGMAHATMERIRNGQMD